MWDALDTINTYRILVGNLKSRHDLERLRVSVHDVTIDRTEIGWEEMVWIPVV
jgi:hypothetical protein